MAETEWNEEGAEAPSKKRRVPVWVWWGCGGGCLLAVLLVAVISIFAVNFVQDAMDPEVVWGKVEEILPHDVRPEGWNAAGQDFFGMGQFVLTPPGSQDVLIVMKFPGAKEHEDMFDSESTSNRGLFGFGAIRDAEDGTIEIQGREARCLRFFAYMPESAQEEGVTGASIRVDLTGTGATPVLVQVTAAEDETVSDEVVRSLLEPFDVWRGR